MSKFALVEIDAVKGKQKFFKIVKDGVCEFEEFESEVKKQYRSEMNRIYALMNKIANLQTLTQQQFRDLTPDGELIKEYEFKTHSLRVYAIHEVGTGKIIITGGYKNTQKSDINHFRELKRQFLNSRSNND